jgi:hypothetical protein
MHMPKAPLDPLGPITIEQSQASAAVRGTLALVCGIALVLAALAGVVMMFSPGRAGTGLNALYAGFLGVGAILFGWSQIKLSKQENRTHFHADLEGIRGLVVGAPDLVPWSSVSSVHGSINDVDIELIDGGTIHIREGLVGMVKGLKGLPSSKKIAERLRNLQAQAQESATPETL